MHLQELRYVTHLFMILSLLPLRSMLPMAVDRKMPLSITAPIAAPGMQTLELPQSDGETEQVDGMIGAVDHATRAANFQSQVLDCLRDT